MAVVERATISKEETLIPELYFGGRRILKIILQRKTYLL
jgi:hypothetical protein